MVKLSEEDILILHDTFIKKYGGEYGIREQGTFEMLCNIPYQTMFGEDLYPTIFDKAAKYLEGFATHQVFYDGNKRTGLAVINVFLNANGYEFTFVNDQAYQFVLDISNGKYKQEDIVNIIKSNIRKGFDLEEAAPKTIQKNIMTEMQERDE